jgi:hypothetical protein
MIVYLHLFRHVTVGRGSVYINTQLLLHLSNIELHTDVHEDHMSVIVAKVGPKPAVDLNSPRPV